MAPQVQRKSGSMEGVFDALDRPNAMAEIVSAGKRLAEMSAESPTILVTTDRAPGTSPVGMAAAVRELAKTDPEQHPLHDFAAELGAGQKGAGPVAVDFAVRSAIMLCGRVLKRAALDAAVAQHLAAETKKAADAGKLTNYQIHMGFLNALTIALQARASVKAIADSALAVAASMVGFVGAEAKDKYDEIHGLVIEATNGLDVEVAELFNLAASAMAEALSQDELFFPGLGDAGEDQNDLAGMQVATPTQGDDCPCPNCVARREAAAPRH